MRIAVVAPTQIPARRANTVQVMKMAQALRQAGHEVHLLSPAQDASLLHHPVSWAELAHHYGLSSEFSVRWLRTRPAWRGYDFGASAVLAARRLQSDLVYTRHPQAAALASLSGTPTILEVHDLPQGRMGPLLLRIFLLGRGARRLTAITRALAGDLGRLYGAPAAPPFTLIAPDGVDLERYEGLPEPRQARLKAGFPLHLPEDRFIAGYSGHFYDGRGADLLLEIARQAPEILFLLMGGEPQQVERIKQTAEQRQLANVILTGFIPNADLPYYQAACDALLMPYQQRIAGSSGGNIAPYLSPMKLFEYLACGRPILSSDLPVLREVLDDANAVLLPPNDSRAWVAALRRLQEEPETSRNLAQQAKASAQQYTWEKRARRILSGIEAGRHG